MEELLLQILYAASWPIRPYEEGWSGVIALRDHFGLKSWMEYLKETDAGAAYFYSY